jgi:non-specific serine/threonine protein kinase
MSHAEDQIVRSLIKEFIHENIPEHILEGAHAIFANEGVQKVDIKKRENYWDVEGHIQGEDFQIYNSEIGLNLGESTVNFSATVPTAFPESAATSVRPCSS